jgi:hypothetical protein
MRETCGRYVDDSNLPGWRNTNHNDYGYYTRIILTNLQLSQLLDLRGSDAGIIVLREDLDFYVMEQHEYGDVTGLVIAEVVCKKRRRSDFR